MRVGVDIGGTKTHAVAVTAEGAVTQQLRLPTGFGSEAVVATAVDAVTRLATLAGFTETRQFDSIGVGIPGAVDSSTGRVSHAVNLGFDGLELGGRLTSVLGRNVRVENDVNAAALGAFHLLGKPADSSMAYLGLGTGLAAGIVLGGRLWRGARGTAGEIGHIPIDPNGPVCSCGQRGCLEMVASGAAVTRQWPTTDPKPVHALFAAAARGEPLAVEVKRSLVDSIAASVRMLVLAVDVESVVIGGGISSLGDELLGEVRTTLARWSEASPFLASLELPQRVSLVPTGVPAAAVGAAFVGAG